MQLSEQPALTAASSTRSTLRLALGAATGALLAAGAAAQTAAQPLAPSPAPMGTASAPAAAPTAGDGVVWQADAAVLRYAESRGRVQALEPIVALRRSDGDERVTSLRLTLDTLTGASPTGAVPQPQAQTTTSASGEGVVNVSAGAVPMDHRFKDQRAAGQLGHEQAFGEGRRLRLGANASGETDYLSYGLDAALSQDFDQHRSTVSLGWAWAHDLIKPVGRVPAGLQPRDTAHRVGVSRSRDSIDLLLGWTQVFGRRWLGRFNLGHGRSEGYLSDPYKVLSVVDPVSGLETGDIRVAEARPRTRRRTTLFTQHKLRLDAGVLDASLRLYRDSWGIDARTLELAWRQALGGGWSIEPQWRHHRQGAADFYRPYLLEGIDYVSSAQAPTVAAASADPRLGALSATTLGLNLALELGAGRELLLRASQYRQRQHEPGGAPGYLAQVRLTEDLSARTLLLAWSQRF